MATSSSGSALTPIRWTGTFAGVIEPPSPRTFLRALFSSWLTGMSGPLSVPLAITAIIVPGDLLKTGLGLTAFVCIWAAAYGLWKPERLARIKAETARTERRLEIVFDDTDQTYVRPVERLHGPTGEFYWVGIRNAGSVTIDDVTLRAREGWFVQNTIAVAHARDPVALEREPVVARLSHLDPGATEMVPLFGKDYHIGSADDVFRDVRRFALELRGRDTSIVVAELEYDPSRRPMIKMLPAA